MNAVTFPGGQYGATTVGQYVLGSPPSQNFWLAACRGLLSISGHPSPDIAVKETESRCVGAAAASKGRMPKRATNFMVEVYVDFIVRVVKKGKGWMKGGILPFR